MTALGFNAKILVNSGSALVQRLVNRRTPPVATTLIVPGLNSSGPAHWQTWFEEHIPGSLRVVQSDWKTATLPDWSARVRRDIARTPGQLFVVAHSFGTLAAVQAAVDHSNRIAGALLVAPADPDKFGVEALLPQSTLPFPTVVVGSTNDPWMTLERAAHWADLWGADLVNLGASGHINAESGFGPWPEGLALLERLKLWSRRRDLSAVGAVRRQRRLLVPAAQAIRARGRTGTVHAAALVLKRAGWEVRPPHGVSTVTATHHQ